MSMEQEQATNSYYRMDGSFHAPDGASLVYGVIAPSTPGALRGVIVFLHGINDHTGMYTRVFNDCCARGFAVLAYDLRGHGRSHKDVDGLIGHVDHFQSLVDDTNAFIAFAKQEILPTKLGMIAVDKDKPGQHMPLLLMGMSLGTLIAVHTVLSGAHAFDSLILVAPAISVEWTPTLSVVGFFGRVLSFLAPTKRWVPPGDESRVCRDPKYMERYIQDPLATRAPLTCRMGDQTLQFMAKLASDPQVDAPTSPLASLPILMMMGSDDGITSVPTAHALFERLATNDKTFIEIPGAYHVLFEDPDRDNIMKQLFAWMDSRFPVVQNIMRENAAVE